MVRLGAKKGSWLGVKYGDKTISGQVREVDTNPGWPDFHYLWLDEDSARKLGLFNHIKGNTETNPPDVSFSVTVWKYLLTQSKTLLPAIATFVVTLLTALFSGFVSGGIFPDYKLYFEVGLVVLVIIASFASALTVYEHKN